MNRIENYIATLSKHVSLEPKELDDFKHEIRSHLNDTVKALQQEGYSEEESMTIALKRFGEEEQINAELRKLYRFQTSFKKSTLIVSCLMLVLSLIFVVYAQFHDSRNSAGFDNMLHDYHNNLEGKIADNSVTHAEIEAYFSEHKRILRAVMLSQTMDGQTSTEFIYPAGMNKIAPSDESYIPFKVENGDGTTTNWEFRVDLDRSALFSPLPHLLRVTAIVCFALYWMLFALWNVLNAYRMGRLNIFWGIMFFTLNIVGYLVFKMAERISVGRLRAAI